MRSFFFSALFLATAVSLAGEPQKTVIPFDFASKFDDGRYGQMVGDMIWKKLDREGGFLIPESMLDVRDTCESQNIHPGPDRRRCWRTIRRRRWRTPVPLGLGPHGSPSSARPRALWRTLPGNGRKRSPNCVPREG